MPMIDEAVLDDLARLAHVEPADLRAAWATLVQRMSVAPAAYGRVASQGRPIAVGEPANLVLVDPSARGVVDRAQGASIAKNNPYHGRNLPDPVIATVWAGRVTYQRGT